ncbi:hypothetical protein ACIRVK_37445 [Streptomyces sp. NPDC101152]|uniref:hypothetical protein n=1 Tax=Streptomyces sp. NPDC101152 TaxID=3366116 RepID=UPI00380F99F1
MQRHATVAATAVLAAQASPDAQLVEEPAAVLRRAEAWGHLPAEGWGRIPVAPLTEEYEDLDLAGAYAVEEANVRIRLAAGEHLVGRKVGRTSLPMCEQLGLPEASFGTLFQSIVTPDGGTIDTRELITPRAEAEVGLILGRRLSGPRVRARRSGRPSPRPRRPTPSTATPPRRASPSAVPSTPWTSCSWGSGTSTSGSTPMGSASRLAWRPKSSAIRFAPWPGRPGRSPRTAALSTRASCCFTGSVHAGVPLTPGSRLAVRSGTGRRPELTVTVR